MKRSMSWSLRIVVLFSLSLFSLPSLAQDGKVLTLEQAPRPQGAIYTFDHRNGYVLGMAGGNDFDQSEFNRVTQACRQPGNGVRQFPQTAAGQILLVGVILFQDGETL